MLYNFNVVSMKIAKNVKKVFCLISRYYAISKSFKLFVEF